MKTISAPKVTTLQNQKASISQGVSIPFSQVSAQGVNTTFVEARLQLDVTPHITSDGSILMAIKATNNQPDPSNTGANGQPAISKKEAETQVLVKDGDTTVIGGIYVRRGSNAESGVPFLMKLPILGFFFRTSTVSEARQELLIFITPRIVTADHRAPRGLGERAARRRKSMSIRSRSSPLAALGPAVALLLAGCSADPLNVVILNARASGDKCDFADATLYTEGGSVDFSPWTDSNGNSGQTVSYGQIFSWENQMLPSPISVNGQVVDPGGGSDFIADTAVYTYQYTDPNVVLSPETQNLRAVIAAAGTPEKNSVGAQLIQPQAAVALDNTLTATPQTLLVTFQLFGKTGAGREQEHQQGHLPGHGLQAHAGGRRLSPRLRALRGALQHSRA